MSCHLSNSVSNQCKQTERPFFSIQTGNIKSFIQFSLTCRFECSLDWIETRWIFCSGQLKHRLLRVTLTSPYPPKWCDIDFNIPTTALLVGLTVLGIFSLFAADQDADKVTATPKLLFEEGRRTGRSLSGGLVRSENPTLVLLTINCKQIGFQTHPPPTHTLVRKPKARYKSIFKIE